MTAGLGLATIRLVPSTFQASASVVLLPPTTAVTDVGNPYLVLGGLSQAVDVLIHRASADAAQTPIVSAYPRTMYLVQRDITTSGPIITIVVDGPTSAETMDALKAVMTMVPAQLGELQDQLSVATRARIGLMTLSQDAKPTTVDKARTRALLAVVAAGLIATVLLVGLLDGLISGRRRRSIAGTEDLTGVHFSPAEMVDAPPVGAPPVDAPAIAAPPSAEAQRYEDPMISPPVEPLPSPARTTHPEPADRDSTVRPGTTAPAPVTVEDASRPPPRASRIRLTPRPTHDGASTHPTDVAVALDQPSSGKARGTSPR